MTDIHAGQIWESTDPRDSGRRFEIEEIGVWRDLAFVRNLRTNRHSVVALRRLRETNGKRGYRQVIRAPLS